MSHMYHVACAICSHETKGRNRGSASWAKPQVFWCCLAEEKCRSTGHPYWNQKSVVDWLPVPAGSRLLADSDSLIMWSLHRVLLQCWQSSACSAAGKTRNGGILFDCLNQVHFREKIRWTHISAFWMTVSWTRQGPLETPAKMAICASKPREWLVAPLLFKIHGGRPGTCCWAACGNEDVWLIIMAGLPHTYNHF